MKSPSLTRTGGRHGWPLLRTRSAPKSKIVEVKVEKDRQANAANRERLKNAAEVPKHIEIGYARGAISLTEVLDVLRVLDASSVTEVQLTRDYLFDRLMLRLASGDVP